MMKKSIIYIVLSVLILPILLFKYELPEMNFANYDYAHRGHFNEEIPENSLMSIEKAIKLDKGIEIDIRLSKDEQPMVFHDYRLERMTGHDNFFGAYNKDELEKIYLMNSLETIPSLDEALKLIDGKVPLILDLKGDIVSNTLEDKVLKALNEYDGTVYLQSANPVTNRYLSKKSNYKIGYITISLLPVGDVAFQKFQAYLADSISEFDYVALNGKYFKKDELRAFDRHLIWFVNKNRMNKPKLDDNSI
jgi:glycerophosphoryl diester phosphodiesterase